MFNALPGGSPSKHVDFSGYICQQLVNSYLFYVFFFNLNFNLNLLACAPIKSIQFHMHLSSFLTLSAPILPLNSALLGIPFQSSSSHIPIVRMWKANSCSSAPMWELYLDTENSLLRSCTHSQWQVRGKK